MPVISTNTAANSALRYLNINSDNQASPVSKIASGSRITKASDDAAGRLPLWYERGATDPAGRATQTVYHENA